MTRISIYDTKKWIFFKLNTVIIFHATFFQEIMEKKKRGKKKGKIKIIIMKSTLVYAVSSKICPTKKQSIVGISALIKLVHGETR